MTQQEKEKMFLDLNSVLVKFWIEQGRPDKEIKIELLERMLNWQKKAGIVIPDEQSKEPVSDDLEKEIKTWIPAHIVGGDKAPWKELKDVVIQWAGIVARHFYILGLKNNIPVTQITLDELAKEGESVNEDLEKAAEEYRRESYTKSVLPNIDGPMPEYGGSIKDAFIAGAEWQGMKLFEEGLDAVRQDSPSKIEKTIAGVFVKYGMNRMKREMLKEAVEGLICATITGTDAISFLSPLPKELTAGDKVKIIIVKEEE